MRLLFYGPNYAPEKTGTGKYTAEMAEWFAGRGHEVHVITGPPHYPEWRLHEAYANRHGRETRNGVKVRRVPMYIPPAGHVTSRRRIRMETSFSWHAARAWRKWFLGREKPDVVIAVCPPMQVGMPPRFLRAFRQVPWVFHIQDFQVDAAVRLGLLKPTWFTQFLYRIEQGLLRRADAVSTITPGMAARLQEKGVSEDRIWQVPNWSDLNFMRPGDRMNPFRAKMGYGPEDIVLLYAGNMGKKQGLDIVLDVADRLRDDQQLQFLLVGDGAVRQDLEQRAQALELDNVRFMDLQPWSEVPEMLNAADLHLVIQRAEAADLVMPSKLTNILAVGGVPIATAPEGSTLAMVIEESNAGTVVPPEHVDALTQAIQKAAGDATWRDSARAGAQAYAKHHLDRDAILASFERQLLALTDAGR